MILNMIEKQLEERSACIKVILDLLPKSYKSILMDYDSSGRTTVSEVNKWINQKIIDIIKHIDTLRDDHPSERTETVPCPLCKTGNWKFPGELAHHLQGIYGKSQCSVIRSIWAYKIDRILYTTEKESPLCD